MSLVRWLVPPFALGVSAVLVIIACGKDLPPEPPEAGDAGVPVEGGILTEAGIITCEGIECGGLGGRCGEVKTCGLSIKCGECTAPATCDSGTCDCPKTTCKTTGATCGTGFSDGCGGKFDCGTCPAGTNCQSIDGGPFGCTGSDCFPAPDTCMQKTKCGVIKNNCAQDVTCTCNPDRLCGGAGTPGLCGCGLALTAITEWVRTDGVDLLHCYDATGANVCEGIHNGFGESLTPFKTHPSALPALMKLRRCFSSERPGITYLTTDATCPFGGQVSDIGYCATTANACGSTALHRFKRQSTGDFVYSTSPQLPATGAFTEYQPEPSNNNVVCYVWL